MTRTLTVRIKSDMRRATRYLTAAAAVVTLSVSAVLLTTDTAHGVTPPASARVVQIEEADTPVTRVRVVYAEPLTRGRLYVELNNGATYRFTACQVEDSRNCYWDARTRGNGEGNPVVNIRGDYMRVPLRFL